MTSAIFTEEPAAVGAPAVELGSRRVLHPGPLRWLRALGWMVLLFAVVGIAAAAPEIAAFVLTRAEEPGLPAGPAGVATALATAAAGGLVYAGLVRLGERRLPRELAPRAALAELPLGLAIGAALFSAVMAVMAAGGFYEIRAAAPTDAWSALAISMQSGFVEELLMRAIVLRLLWRAFGLGWAVVLSSALFGALHLTNPNATWFAAVAIALEAGLLLGALYALTGRLWVSVGTHAAWNFTQGWIFGVTVSGSDALGGGPLASAPAPGSSDLVTGGAFGAEASLPALIVAGAVALALLGLAWRLGRFREPA